MNINIDEVLKLNNINIIDIRNNYSYVNGHIPNSINIEGHLLLKYYYRYLKKDKKYYIYCDSGKRSSILCSRLRELGYDVVNINGGYNSYLFRSVN